MKMRKLLFLSFALFLFCSLSAQVPKVGLEAVIGGGSKYALKASLVGFYDISNRLNLQGTHRVLTRNGRLGPPTASLLIYGNGKGYKELELVLDMYTQFQSFSAVNANLTHGAYTTNWKVGPAFSYYFGMGNPLGKVQFLLGLRNALVVSGYETRPFITTEFPERAVGVELHLEAVPGIRIDWSDRLFSDFLIPFRYAEMTLQNVRVQDPSVPVREQNVVNLEFDNRIFNLFQARFSLGVNL